MNPYVNSSYWASFITPLDFLLLPFYLALVYFIAFRVVNRRYPKGDPMNPATQAEREEKFRMLMNSTFSPEHTEKTLAVCKGLEHVANVGEFVKLFVKEA